MAVAPSVLSWKEHGFGVTRNPGWNPGFLFAGPLNLTKSVALVMVQYFRAVGELTDASIPYITMVPRRPTVIILVL